MQSWWWWSSSSVYDMSNSGGVTGYLRGSHGLNACMERRMSSRGPKSLQLDVWAPRLLVVHMITSLSNLMSWTRDSGAQSAKISCDIFTSLQQKGNEVGDQVLLPLHPWQIPQDRVNFSSLRKATKHGTQFSNPTILDRYLKSTWVQCVIIISSIFISSIRSPLRHNAPL